MAGKVGRIERKAFLSEAAPHYHGHRERLRARFREAGSDAVSDYELLELVLFRAIPQRDIKPLAKELIAKFGSFAEVVAAPQARLAEVKGMGEAAVTELKVVHAAASRLARGQMQKRTVLSSWSSVMAVSTDRRNTLSLREKMECDDGSEISSRFYGGREDGAMGPLAAWGVAQGYWAGFW